MLTDIIIRYLESNKRLVVPQLGSFVVKAPGRCILFTELFRRDDGVLRGLLHAEGMGEVEAAGAVDRFVFEVRHALQEGRDYPMEGFGLFRRGPDGTLLFTYTRESGSSAAPHLSAADEMNGGRRDDTSVPQGPQTSDTGSPKKAGSTAAPRAGGTSPNPPSGPPFDPSVKGLRYGKPVKTTDAYAYVGAAPRRRVDKLILVAIVAAVLALAAIAYGYIRELQAGREQVAETEEVLPITPPAARTAPAEPETQKE